MQKTNFFFLLFSLWFLSTALSATDTKASYHCQTQNCENEVVFFCPTCQPRGEPWPLCADCAPKYHKMPNTRRHQYLSISHYEMLKKLNHSSSPEEFRDSYYEHLLVGPNFEAGGLVFGKGLETLASLEQTPPIITVAGPTGAGKSYLGKFLCGAEKAGPCPALTHSLISTTTGVQGFLAPIKDILTSVIDLEGIRGMPQTTQANAVLHDAKLSEALKYMAFLYPPLIYSVSDLLIYMTMGASQEIQQHMIDLLFFAQAAARRSHNSPKPVLIICFNRRSSVEISAEMRGEEGFKHTTKMWETAFQKERNELLAYFSAIHVVYLDSLYTNPSVGLSQFEAFKNLLAGIIKQRASDSAPMSSLNRKLMFAKFKEAALALEENPDAFVNFADYYTENFTNALLSLHSKLEGPDDYESFKDHLEMALQLNLGRWIANYKPLKIDLLDGIAFDDVPSELPKRLAQLFKTRLTCQAKHTFNCKLRGEITVNCDQFPWHHEESHKSHEIFFSDLKADADKYWLQHEEKDNANPCVWRGDFEAAVVEGEAIEFDPCKLLVATFPYASSHQACALCFSSINSSNLFCGSHGVCYPCHREFPIEKRCIVCEKNFCLEKMMAAKQQGDQNEEDTEAQEVSIQKYREENSESEAISGL